MDINPNQLLPTLNRKDGNTIPTKDISSNENETIERDVEESNVSVDRTTPESSLSTKRRSVYSNVLSWLQKKARSIYEQVKYSNSSIILCIIE